MMNTRWRWRAFSRISWRTERRVPVGACGAVRVLVWARSDRAPTNPHRLKSLCGNWKFSTSAAKADLIMQALCHG
jgi:hypothetical protein